MNRPIETVKALSVHELAARLADNKPLFLLDVRESHEVEICSIAGAVHIPMQLIPIHLDRLPDESDIVIYCHHGIRSLSVANYLVSAGFDVDYLYNLTGGIDSWATEIDSSMAKY